MDTAHENALEKAFIEIHPGIQTWFLDTCVWSAVISANQITNQFISFFQKNNYLAGLTAYTLFELSRASGLFDQLDALFFKMRHNIWIALLYDQLYDAELNSYPSKPRIRWMPLSMLTGEDEKQAVNFMTKIAKNQLFVSARDEHLDFGYAKFMSLEKFKKNFRPSDGTNYSTAQVKEFARLTGLDYFRRRDPSFLRKISPSSFVSEGIPSQYARSLFVFYKFYIHGQSPNKSDFLDFAHISYVPYFHVYATEKNAANVLRHIKSTGLSFSDMQVMDLPQFIEMLHSA